MNKKGVSKIVALIFIIILSLSVVVILWAIISSLINRTTEQVDIEILKERVKTEEAISVVEGGAKQAGEDKKGCMPNWNCEEWSGCELGYNLENIIEEEVSLDGETQRECEDLNECLEKKVEKENCKTKTTIEIKKVIVGDKEYIEIYDKEKGKLVAIIELEEMEKLNIEFVI